jgi:uncharacterized protein YutE (UPF0331/DUF86 family)
MAQCFEILGEYNLIEKELTNRLVKMARFRNLLIHKYWKIDEKRVYEYAKNNQSDFENFISSIKTIFIPNKSST